MEKAYAEGIGFGEAQFPFKSKEYTDPAQVKYSEVHCPVAASLRDQTVSLFLHPSWERCHIERVIEAVKAVIAKHTK
jgi:dTDP-4-amino-4,6-dideoxygalactose transaminase